MLAAMEITYTGRLAPATTPYIWPINVVVNVLALEGSRLSACSSLGTCGGREQGRVRWPFQRWRCPIERIPRAIPRPGRRPHPEPDRRALCGARGRVLLVRRGGLPPARRRP